MRKFSLIDRVITELNLGINSVFVASSSPSVTSFSITKTGKTTKTNRINPSQGQKEPELSLRERKHSAGLIRVDHTGEICAQALYRGQAFFAKSLETREYLLHAALEEEDHLVWCHDRLIELASRRSYLNFFWYLASFFIGITAASFGDDWSHGFVVETENQVERHLDLHLAELPSADFKSRMILRQMKIDEVAHASAAKERGGKELPKFIKALMQLQSRVMTRTSYWV